MKIAKKTIMLFYINVSPSMSEKEIEKIIKRNKKRLRLDRFKDLVAFFSPTFENSRIEILR